MVKMNHNLKYLQILIPLLIGLLAACTSAQPQATIQVPVTGLTVMVPTATSALTPAPASTNAPSALSSSEIKFVLVPSKSSAGYTVREQLAKLSLPSDAIGTTNSITGSITILPDGTIDSANSKFTVDVSTLKTDQSMRDNFVRRAVLHTDQYPLAVFVPTQVTGLPATLPQSGDVAFKVTGNLTIQNVTKPITWDVSGTINNGEATGKATTSFTFEDFNLTQPHISVVLSIVDKINLTVTGDLQRSSN
jgi:polyisoprenoid-binding protein YceI